MKLLELVSEQALITEISTEVIDLANFLEIPHEIEKSDDHIYIKEPDLPLSLSSFFIRRDSDVMVSPKIFCEILMDIKSGMSVLEAYNKHGYTFEY